MPDCTAEEQAVTVADAAVTQKELELLVATIVLEAAEVELEVCLDESSSASSVFSNSESDSSPSGGP